MKRSYRCLKCKTYFIDPLITRHGFVCPNCKHQDFETVVCKKHMIDCCK